MIPVTQTRTGAQGNCFEACMASLLEVPLSEVPDFGRDDVFLEKVAGFLEPHGLLYVQIAPHDDVLGVMMKRGDIFHTIEGRSPRGGQHAVVGCNGHVVHDPHPQDGTGRGLISVDCYGLLCSRMDPSSF